MDYIDKIFLWIGRTSKSQKQFDEYFELDYSEDRQNRKVCGFCKDIGEKWYDEDFIGYLRFDYEMGVGEILEHVPINQDDISKVLNKCKELNLDLVNSSFI